MKRFITAKNFWSFAGFCCLAVFAFLAGQSYISGILTGLSVFLLSDIAAELWPKHWKRLQDQG